MQTRLSALAALAAITVPVFPAQSHHSNSAYQVDEIITLTGTVMEWRWSNPHTWLILVFFRSPEPLPGEPILRPLAGVYKTRISHLAGNNVVSVLRGFLRLLVRRQGESEVCRESCRRMRLRYKR